MPDPKIYETVKTSVTELRKKLHSFPELSGEEDKTLDILKDYFSKLHPSVFYKDIGGNSIAWEFTGKDPQITVIFRADTDALPIPDEIDKPYASVNEGIGHKCGHDGHMSILAGFANLLSDHPPQKSKIILLFQSEEETGQGAEKLIQNEWFKKLKPDYVFGLHNLPGFPSGHIILKNEIFASSSVGMKIRLKGRSSHAGQPEDGISPALAISKLIGFIQKEIPFHEFDNFCLATIIHLRLGEVAFGTSPGEADFMVTLRAAEEDDLDSLIQMITNETEKICKEEKLIHNIGFTEKFPSTVNHPEGYKLVLNAAEKSGLNTINIEKPFRWSEDFGHYLKHSKGAFFGLGAGRNIPALHNPDYDFPDEILISGIKIFHNVYLQLENKN